MSKTCCLCKLEKELSEYYQDAKRIDGYRPRCISCEKELKRKWHRDNNHKHRDRYRKAAQKKREALRQEINQIKETTPCMDCGVLFPACCMDFDHTSDDKVTDVATLVGKGKRNAAMKELTKCEIVCACCHRLRTKARRVAGTPGGEPAVCPV